MKLLCISASNILHSHNQSTSWILCKRITQYLNEKNIECEVIDLRNYDLSPCIGCGKCYDSRRCCHDNGFNEIYERIIQSDGVFFVSPHYAPIPAKLSMILEKMEEITFLHWWKDNTYKSEVCSLPAAVISHGGGADWALESYKAMVNDTIANALDTIQMKIVSYSNEWDTGLVLCVADVTEEKGIFPVQKYDWDSIDIKLRKYIDQIVENRLVCHKPFD